MWGGFYWGWPFWGQSHDQDAIAASDLTVSVARVWRLPRRGTTWTPGRVTTWQAPRRRTTWE